MTRLDNCTTLTTRSSPLPVVSSSLLTPSLSLTANLSLCVPLQKSAAQASGGPSTHLTRLLSSRIIRIPALARRSDAWREQGAAHKEGPANSSGTPRLLKRCGIARAGPFGDTVAGGYTVVEDAPSLIFYCPLCAGRRWPKIGSENLATQVCFGRRRLQNALRGRLPRPKTHAM